MKAPSIVIGTLASLFLVGSYTSAEAQQQQEAPQQQMPQQQAPEISVDSDEIERFANAFENVQGVQDEARDNMMQAIEEEGLDIETYNQAFRMQQQGADPSEELSQEEQQQFEQADSRIDEIEQEAQSDIEQAITDADLEVERFEEIFMGIQQDPELQQQVQEAIQQ
ncbi:DUF4168 domain-containing protein [Euhalothece natronophila]|nr:DUF4168 domain-containing protein [Euhalothece natronophila]